MENLTESADLLNPALAFLSPDYEEAMRLKEEIEEKRERVEPVTKGEAAFLKIMNTTGNTVMAYLTMKLEDEGRLTLAEKKYYNVYQDTDNMRLAALSAKSAVEELSEKEDAELTAGIIEKSISYAAFRVLQSSC
jgi:hypothetical protein